jgi:hypothetical protein
LIGLLCLAGCDNLPQLIFRITSPGSYTLSMAACKPTQTAGECLGMPTNVLKDTEHSGNAAIDPIPAGLTQIPVVFQQNGTPNICKRYSVNVGKDRVEIKVELGADLVITCDPGVCDTGCCCSPPCPNGPTNMCN